MTIARILLVVVLSVAYAPAASAVSIGPECEPSGVIAMGKEAWDPEAFWAAQVEAIKDYVEGKKSAYRLSQIERKRDKVNERLDAEEMEAMGIEQYSDPELEREMDRIDRELMEMDRQMLRSAIEWGHKCTAYARSQLEQARQ